MSRAHGISFPAMDGKFTSAFHCPGLVPDKAQLHPLGGTAWLSQADPRVGGLQAAGPEEGGVEGGGPLPFLVWFFSPGAELHLASLWAAYKAWCEFC